MAWNTQGKPYFQNNGTRSSNNSGSGGTKPENQSVEPLTLPADYVDKAEKLMEIEYKNITTSKLRKILTLVNDIYNVENKRTDDTLLSESQTKIQLMKIKVVYECGRDPKVKTFIEKSRILQYIKGLGTRRDDFIRFAHYMEALVAYHKYYGGREN